MMKNSLERLESREAKKEMINKQSIFTTHVLIILRRTIARSGSNNANNNNTNNNSSNTINNHNNH